MSDQEVAQDIISSVLNLDKIDKAKLVEYFWDELDGKTQEKLAAIIKEQFEFLDDDEAREKYEDESHE